MEGSGADFIDWETFKQILEMDDPDDNSFSTSIIENFFEQAKETMDQIHTALHDQDLESLSSLGHFLKGSSAALGLYRVQNSCERIQHYGEMKDEAGTINVPDKDICLQRIQDELATLKSNYLNTEQCLRSYLGNSDDQ